MDIRLNSFLPTATVIQVAHPAETRKAISFWATDVVTVRPGADDVVSLTPPGLPVVVGFWVRFEGPVAALRWTAVSAGTPLLGVMEEY